MCCSASEMSGGKYLLLFTVFVLLGTCQPKPQVVMSPQTKEIFSGDSFYLNCTNSGSGVTWLFNNNVKQGVNEIWKIAAASPADSGSYKCQSNGQTSDSVTIKVLDSVPKALLTIQTGHPVMQFGHAVILKLHNDDGLVGWMCHIYREARNEKKKVKFKLENNNTVVFQTAPLRVPETIYWCTDQDEQGRSNQIVLRASDKQISLEMYPQLAVLGESLTLRCLTWGTDQISEAVFSKDGEVIERGTKPTFKISEVTDNTKGKYKCNATYTYSGHTYGNSYRTESDVQDVFVQQPIVKAVLSGDKASMTCSCSKPEFQSTNLCYWYYSSAEGVPLKHLKNWKTCDESANEAGYYTCRLAWDNQRSELSAVYYVSGEPTNPIIIVIIIFLVLVGLICIVIAIYRYKRRVALHQIYEDMPMRDREYDVLTKGSDDKRETEYDTIQPHAQDKDKATGEYEALKKDGAKDEVYHTLGGEGGAAGGEGGYEALKKGGVKEQVYHTLKAEVVATEGGEGGYEALKKEGKKEGEYDTLKEEVVATGGDGGYEALKKEGMKEGEYDTLKAEVVATGGGDGGYEALKKEGMKGGVYSTLGGEKKEEGKTDEQ